MLARNRLRLRHVLLAACLSLAALPAQAVITITEIMYHPPGGGGALEFIELHNETADPMDLTGYYFSKGVDFVFTARTFLDPGAYIVVCADMEHVKSVYGIQNVAGNWDSETSLDNSGEAIELSNPGGVVEARVRYNDRGKWPSGADGTGHSLEIEYVYEEMDDPDNWALSSVLGGSPGKANPARTAGSVVINEASTRGASGSRWVELYNPGAAPVDLSGYHLTTDRADLSKATLPAGTVLGPREWMTFQEEAIGLDFTPDLAGRTFIALTTPAGDGLIDARLFEIVKDGVSEGRIPDGGRLFSSAADPTPGSANRVSVIEDIIINEILYHPIENGTQGEFVELYNRGSVPVDLTGWGLTDGVNFDLPAGIVLQPEAFLVVARDPAHIRDLYRLLADAVVGPADDAALERFGILSDEGERVTLSDSNGNIADTVRYYDGGEWPRWADGGGSTMELIDPWQDNSVAQAWDSSDESGKTAGRRYEYTGTFTGTEASAPQAEFHILLAGAGITLVDDLRMVTRITSVTPLTTFVDFGDTWKYWKGLSEPSDPVPLWRGLAFDDAAWLSGPAIIGFGDLDESTTLDDMRGSYTSFYVRKEFMVDDPSAIESLVFEIEYDDGYVAYLNGTEIAVGNMRPGEEGRAYNSTAIGSKEKVQEQIDLTERKGLLNPGRNLLAVQVHNGTLAGNDARFKARLINGHFSIQESPNLFRDGTFDTEAYRTSWVIEGNHIRSGRTAVAPLAGAGSLKIVATGDGDNKVNRIETSNTGLGPPLTRATYEVSFLARWIAGAPTLLTHGNYSGTSPPSYASSTRLDVPPDVGTPGAVNGVTTRQIGLTGSSNLGPVISKVLHSPAIPAPGAAALVTARVVDPDSVASVTLFYSLDTPQPAGSPSLLSVPMLDPDGDGIYSAEVPGQILKKRVVYHIVASDSKGQTGRFPVDHVNRTHPLVLDPAAPSVNDPSYVVYRHDTFTPGRVPSYRFWLHQANEQYLTSRRLHSNDMVEGTFIFQGSDVYYGSKLRFAGSPFARQPWSESYRLRMPKDKPLHGYIESYNLEDHQGAGARDGRERISDYLIRYNQGPTRVPYSLQWLVQFQANDRVNEVREHTQVPNGELVKRWFPEDDKRHFFEMDDRHIINDSGTRESSNDGRLLYPPYGPATLGPDKEQYRYYFNLRLDEDLDDYSGLIELAKLLTPTVTPNAQFDEEVWDLVDVEAFCRVWAVRLNTDDWDQWSGTRGKNCYLYRGDHSGRWVLLPWDMELTYGSVSAFMPPALTASSNPPYSSAFVEVTRFLNRPAIKRVFYEVMREMVVNQFQSSFLAPFMAKLDAIGVQSTAVGKPGGFIDQRRAQLLTRVGGVSSGTINFTVTTNGGAPITIASSTFTVDGKAPIEISHIAATVNGVEIDPPITFRFSNTDVLGWNATGVLPPGENRIEFIGLGSMGNVIDTVPFTITVTPGRGTFIRGDTDMNGAVNITDAVALLRHLFQGDPPPPCLDAADGDDSGVLEMNDAVLVLLALFLGGEPPPAPHPDPGLDETEDALDCARGLDG